MDTNYWLNLCKDIGEKVSVEVKKYLKKKIRKKILNVGAGGDKTMFIDDVAEKIIFDHFKSTKRSFIFVSEEIGKKIVGKKPEVMIVVDPLDGSNNISYGIPIASTSISIGDLSGKIRGVKVGYVKDLIKGHYYHAIKGKGAFKNDESIHVTNEKTGCFIVDIAHKRRKNFERIVKLGENSRSVRMLGSCCLGMCLFAEGTADGYVGLGAERTIDHTASQLIIIEAGGVIKDLTGRGFTDYDIGFNMDVNFIAAPNHEIYSWIKSLLG
jgi:fructose-1,6-bisphosphatase/inositol monophosphatase family enzyme